MMTKAVIDGPVRQQDQQGDEDRGDGVGPVVTCCRDDDAGYNDRDRAQEVAQNFEVSAANVQALARSSS